MPLGLPSGFGFPVLKNRGLDKSKATKVKKARASASARADGARRPAIEQLESRELLSSTWFVSPGGSNQNPGTPESPFQTIQQAANLAHAGDHVEILAGVYHETVTPPNAGTPGNPITFEAYNGANVTIDGADPISGWTQYKGNIYSAPMSWDLGEGNNEVFVNGAATNEAVWPNSAVGNFSHPVNATIQSSRISGNTAVIYNSALNQPANTWKGAIIHMDPGQNWENQTGTVIASAPGSITISFVNHGQVCPADGRQQVLPVRQVPGAGHRRRMVSRSHHRPALRLDAQRRQSPLAECRGQTSPLCFQSQ